ncbi:hypothetical protein LTR84_001682 [Exophiala bonariae]|uniref:Uncharacterized protein n=1 Tax=Exophiala bonariae TaxID=1690606 RepID=A0AAV9NDQ7_9EURO|nr:hypothetical protein LTR84_001682 [Exophiala bonariae]
MVQYDPFAPLLVDTDLPMRERTMRNTSGNTTPSLVDSPSSLSSPLENFKRRASRPEVEKDEIHPAIHPQLRRLSSSHASSHHYCSKCHMRRSSQDLLKQKHNHSPEPESWDGFCPDIVMPTQDAPRPSAHHTRRHSGLCPENLINIDHQHDGKSSPPQILVKHRPCRQHSTSYHHDCHCESVTPIENLSERYGIVDEPTEMEIDWRRSMEKDAMDRVTEIMHEELIADMEARQARL